MAVFAVRLLKGSVDDSTLEINNEAARIKDAGVTHAKLAQDDKFETDTGVADTVLPGCVLGLTIVAETFADGSNDDVELGKVTVITGSAVEGILGDIGTATVGRVTACTNRSGAAVTVSFTDEGNTTVYGVAKKFAIADGGILVLREQANDDFAIVYAVGVTLVTF